jgi:hypothetical protein
MTATEYADQRGHDVAWMTAAEREALAKLTAAVGSVLVMDVTAEPVTRKAGQGRHWRGTCPQCGKRNATAEHVSWCDWQA